MYVLLLSTAAAVVPTNNRTFNININTRKFLQSLVI